MTESAVLEAPEKKAEKKIKPRKQLTPEELAAEEKKLLKEHKHMVPGSLRNATNRKDATYFQKRTVEIKCQFPGCEAKRRVATSDIHQVRFCPEHTRVARLERRRKARKAD